MVLFALGFLFCFAPISFVSGPSEVDPEDFWGLFVLGSVFLLSSILAFLNLAKIFGYFERESFFSRYANFGFMVLFFLVGMAGVLDSGVTSREMQLGFISASVFLLSGCFFISFGRDVNGNS